MCLTKPVQIKTVAGNIAQLADGRFLNVSLIEKLKIGDWILYTNNFAIKKINQKEAREILNLLQYHSEVNVENLTPEFKEILEATAKRNLKLGEIEYLLKITDRSYLEALYSEADTVRKTYAKDHICIHGIIEFSNYCVNNCLYCGLRRDNKKNNRYRMAPEEIVKIAKRAVNGIGYKMLVLQSGDDYWYTDQKLVKIVKEIKKSARVFLYLSIGDRSLQTYKKLKQAGANGVLYRFETSNPQLYARLHPDDKLTARLSRLEFMKKLGYVLASGPLVGLPGQTISDLAKDILLMKKLNVFMPSLGPFIATPNTPLAAKKDGDFEMSLKMIAVIRMLLKNSRLPVTTAMETIGPRNARELAFRAGANAIMFNLTPEEYRKNYNIYRNKFYDQERKLEKWALFKGEASYEMMEKELKIRI